MNSERKGNQFRWKQWLAALAASSTLLHIKSLDIIWMDEIGERNGILGFVIRTILVILGAILGAVFADNFGRRNTLLIMLIFLIPRTLYFTVGNRGSDGIINTFFVAVDSGITCTVVPLYISEIASNTNRGKLMVTQLFVAIAGIFSTKTLGIGHSYFYQQAVWGITVLAVSISFHAIILGACPETPQYLNWKKMYQEGAHSLAFFGGEKHVKMDENITTSSVNNKRQGWREKIREIFVAENRRSLAMIFSIIIIKQAIGMVKRDYENEPTQEYEWGPTIDYWGLISPDINLIVSFFLMFTIGIFERKLALLLVILGSFTTIIIPMTGLVFSEAVFFGIYHIQYSAYLIYVGVTLAYVGKLFPINVRAIAVALVISFEVLIRNTIFGIESTFGGCLKFYWAQLFFSLGIHIAAFFGILFIFPKNNKVSYSEKAVKTSTGIDY